MLEVCSLTCPEFFTREGVVLRTTAFGSGSRILLPQASFYYGKKARWIVFERPLFLFATSQFLLDLFQSYWVYGAPRVTSLFVILFFYLSIFFYFYLLFSHCNFSYFYFQLHLKRSLLSKNFVKEFEHSLFHLICIFLECYF